MTLYLNVGTIETRKNLISIINAMSVMKMDVPLVVVGKKTQYIEFSKNPNEKNEF